MSFLKKLLKTLWENETGQDLVEYAMMTGFAAMVLLMAVAPTIIQPAITVFKKVMVALGQQPGEINLPEVELFHLGKLLRLGFVLIAIGIVVVAVWRKKKLSE